MKRVAIVGAGLAGLTVAYRLARAGAEVTVIEAAPRLGGQLWTAREDGFVVELGAEGFIARSEAVPRLAADLGMVQEDTGGGPPPTALLGQREHVSYRFEGDELRALPPGEAAQALSFQVGRADRGAGIRTFVGGMQTIADALSTALEEITTRQLGVEVEAIEIDGPRVRVDGVAYDAAVVATSSATAARLLTGTSDVAGIAAGRTLSSVTVSLAFERRQVRHALAGTGFVVGEPFLGFRACTFTSSKFEHRTPPDTVSLRAFFRPTPEELAEDTRWTDRARDVLGRVLPIDGAPLRAWTSIWPSALPVFDEGFAAAVAALDESLGARGVHLAGSAFHGSGIDAAVRSAERVAARLLAP